MGLAAMSGGMGEGAMGDVAAMAGMGGGSGGGSY